MGDLLIFSAQFTRKLALVGNDLATAFQLLRALIALGEGPLATGHSVCMCFCVLGSGKVCKLSLQLSRSNSQKCSLQTMTFPCIWDSQVRHLQLGGFIAILALLELLLIWIFGL